MAVYRPLINYICIPEENILMWNEYELCFVLDPHVKCSRIFNALVYDASVQNNTTRSIAHNPSGTVLAVTP